MAGLYALRIPAVNSELLLSRYSQYLNEYYLKKIASYRNPAAKLRAVCSALLLWRVTKNNGLDFVSLRIGENAYGKPLFQELPLFQFNMSHSGIWVVCGTDEAPLGVDIQEICTKTDLDIAERFFCKEETLSMRALPCAKQRDRFFSLWALKESFIKAEGMGLSIPLDSFSFDFLNGEVFCNAGKKKCSWNCKLYNFDHDYKLALCICGREFPPVTDLSEDLFGKGKYGQL